MANIPTKKLTALYVKACANPGMIQANDTFTLMIKDNRNVEMTHYETVIYRRVNDKVSIGGAYSATDRDNINGLIRLLNVDGCAWIRNGILHYSDDDGIQVSDNNNAGYCYGARVSFYKDYRFIGECNYMMYDSKLDLILKIKRDAMERDADYISSDIGRWERHGSRWFRN